jgi:hypothetical protein
VNSEESLLLTTCGLRLKVTLGLYGGVANLLYHTSMGIGKPVAEFSSFLNKS